MVGGKIVLSAESRKTSPFEGKELKGYVLCCPVKQKRATLASDPPEDSRMRLRLITVRASHRTSPPPYSGYLELPLMPNKPRGSGGRAPGIIRSFNNGKTRFRAEPGQSPLEGLSIDQRPAEGRKSARRLVVGNPSRPCPE